jgi:CheY-like chemotaxis protein
MEKDFLDRAFDPFTQEDGSFTDRFGGSGLGLAVTRQHVERMGGEITAESAKGVGSTFTVTLCLTPTRSEESEEAEEPGDMLESLKGCRILIVEDLPANAEILEDLLELEGAETEHAENGKVGLDMMAASESGYYDAILMDLRMPVMDGLEACRRIRELEHPDAGTIPIIAVTANAAEQDVRECQYVGMNAHLAKPADADLLYDTLKRMIRK